MSDFRISATLKGGKGFEAPWLVFYGNTPEEVKAILDSALDVGLDALVAQAAAGFQGQVTATAALPTQPGVQVQSDPPFAQPYQPYQQTVSSPAPQASVPQGPVAQGSRVETNKWGGEFTHEHPSAPITKFGKAVLKKWVDNSGKPRARWLDPRDPGIPSVYQANGKEKPADLWDGDWAKV